jgi:predicted secreted protein
MECSLFTDQRSKKVILVAHCILNQNAKIDRCAYYPGAIREVTQTVLDKGVGFLQMPCPELLLLGLDRQVEKGNSTCIESEDDRVAERMNEETASIFCKRIACDLVYQIQEYLKNGFKILGVLGINGSPTCGVEVNWRRSREENGYGVLIRALIEECQKYKIDLPMRGIKAKESEKSISTLISLIDQNE